MVGQLGVEVRTKPTQPVQDELAVIKLRPPCGVQQSRHAARLRRSCGSSAKLSEALRDGIRMR